MIRPARSADAEAVASIHNQGIEERTATFETVPRSPELVADQISHWILCLVCERDGQIAGFAKAGPYEDGSHYYDGIAEATVFVERSARGRGAGRELVDGLCAAARDRGMHKLIAKVFAENRASVALFTACGFRQVGTHLRHGSLEGEWKDVVLLERSL